MGADKAALTEVKALDAEIQAGLIADKAVLSAMMVHIANDPAADVCSDTCDEDTPEKTPLVVMSEACDADAENAPAAPSPLHAALGEIADTESVSDTGGARVDETIAEAEESRAPADNDTDAEASDADTPLDAALDETADTDAEASVLDAEIPEEPPIFEKRLAVLQEEDDLLQKIAEKQDAVRIAVVNREWTDFEELTQTLDEYAGQFDALEEERLALFDAEPDAEGETPHFYTLIARLPEDERKLLGSIYRSIKDKTLKVRAANDTLHFYLKEAQAIVGDFMKAAFPDRKTSGYSRRGTSVPSDMRSIVLDTVL